MTRTEDVGAMTWSQFTTLFMEQYYPQMEHDARREEFMHLFQGSLSVAQYESYFTDLSQHATYMVDTEEKKVRQFTQGLRPAF